jgi:hypothetical protein
LIPGEEFHKKESPVWGVILFIALDPMDFCGVLLTSNDAGAVCAGNPRMLSDFEENNE